MAVSQTYGDIVTPQSTEGYVADTMPPLQVQAVLTASCYDLPSLLISCEGFRARTENAMGTKKIGGHVCFFAREKS